MCAQVVEDARSVAQVSRQATSVIGEVYGRNPALEVVVHLSRRPTAFLHSVLLSYGRYPYGRYPYGR